MAAPEQLPKIPTISNLVFERLLSHKDPAKRKMESFLKLKLSLLVGIAGAVIACSDAASAAQSVSRHYLQEARNEVATLISTHFSRCSNGDYYTILERDHGEDIVQLRGIKVKVGPDANYMPLGEVDRANGYQWRGAFEISYRITRKYVNSSWEEWEPAPADELWGGTVDFFKNEWSVEDHIGLSAYKLLACSNVPSG